jgi:hypothetical protein
VIFLTNGNGEPIYVRADAIAVIRKPNSGEYAPHVSSVILADGLPYGVRETMSEILNLIQNKEEKEKELPLDTAARGA